MKLRFLAFFCLTIAAAVIPAAAQTESVITQFTSSNRDSYAGSISGDGRFVVFESTGNLATEDPRNSDGNTEIFLWDFAQRRIFQITDTKAVLKNSFGAYTPANIKVDVVNKRPVISQNGRWIAFASNATASTPTAADASNPGRFYGNEFDFPTTTPLPCPAPSPSPTPTPTATPTPSSTPTATPTPASTPANNPLQCDGNMEIWLYEIPAYGGADLSSGDTAPLTSLSGGNFSLVTNTDPSRYPIEGLSTRLPFIADDNHDASISDNGQVVAFVSSRDLVPGGNPFPDQDNDEIFTFVQGAIATGVEVEAMEPEPSGSRKKNGVSTATNSYAGWSASAPSGGGTGVISQVTRTPRGPASNPIYNKNPSVSGNGSRVVFASTGDNPIIGMTGGNNPESSRNEEIFFSDLDPSGAPTGVRRQVTVTTPTNPGDFVNILDPGKRISRTGQFIAFSSYADLAGEHGGANQAGFATFVYDATASTFRRVLARSNADASASGGDIPRYPGFTDYDENGIPATLVLASRMNIVPNGGIATGSDGLNPESTRPVQIYTLPLNVAPGTATFSRITKFPISNTFLAQTQPLLSDTSKRIAFNLGLTELGGGNPDLLSEAFYLYVPSVTASSTATLQFVTGASSLPIIPTTTGSGPPPTPTPAPTASPTPVTPAAVLGASPGMLAAVNFAEGYGPAVTPRTATGSLTQRPNLPIELSGVSMTIGGYSVGMKAVDSNRILFVVPEALSGTVLTGASYTVVINNQGTQTRGFITLVPTRPDIFNDTGGPGGRAQASNVTNRVHTTEPFTVRTVKIKGGLKVPSVIRLRVTGILNVPSANISIRIGSVNITGTPVLTGGVLVEPGVQTIDFQLPATLNGAGDQPIIVTVTVGGTTFTSRLDDTAPRIAIL